MPFWILLFIVAVIMSVIWWLVHNMFSDLWFIPLIVTLVFGVTAMLFFVSYCTASIFGEVGYKVQSDIKIVAFENNQNDSEGTFVGISYTDFGTCYYYLEETEAGYNLHKVPAQNAQICYTDGEPHVETMVSEFENELLRYLFFKPSVDKQYVIYCPEGTVGNDLIVNLE